MALTQEQINTRDGFLAIKADVKRRVLTVQDFGAVGNGITDDTAAIINAVTLSSGTIVFPPTSAYYKISNLMTFTGLAKKKIVATGAKILNSDLTKASWLFTQCTDIDVTGGDFGYVNTPTANGGNSQHVIQFDRCAYVDVDKIHVLNSPEMGVAITQSFNVKIRRSKIEHTWRDGIYSHASAEIDYDDCQLSDNKDDAMSFHDYGHAAERTFISNLGYVQAYGIRVNKCKVKNSYQGFSSVAGSGISVTKCEFRNTVLAGVALMNQKVLYPDGTARLSDAVIDGNKFFSCCTDTVINGNTYANNGQASTGRGSIMCVSLGDNNQLDLTQPKRQTNVRIRNNYVQDSGALGMCLYNTDYAINSNNTFVNCKVSGNSLGGSVVEVWECQNYLEESTNTVIDNRNPIQHERGYNYSGVYGTVNNWVVTGRTVSDGLTGNSPQIKSAAKPLQKVISITDNLPLTLEHHGAVIVVTAANLAVTIPTSTLPVGWFCVVQNSYNVSSTLINGTTCNYQSGKNKITNPFGTVTIRCIADNWFFADGDITT